MLPILVPMNTQQPLSCCQTGRLISSISTDFRLNFDAAPATLLVGECRGESHPANVTGDHDATSAAPAVEEALATAIDDFVPCHSTVLLSSRCCPAQRRSICRDR